MNECVSYSTRGPVGLVHLDRPDRLNAVVPALVDGILAAFERARADGVRAGGDGGHRRRSGDRLCVTFLQ